MSKKLLGILSILLISAFVLTACSPANNATPEVIEEAGNGSGNGNGSGQNSGENEESEAQPEVVESALKITGSITNQVAWTEDEVHAMPTTDAESTNSNGETETYTGVLISELINLAAPTADASTLVIIADDGTTAEIGLSEILSCEDCILSFRNKGGFSAVLPGYDKSLQVKGVVELQVK